ncbi:MAG: response regulator [Patescibacteria group bacterium]
MNDKVILIVDDDPTLLEMYSERLKAEGAIVLQAMNGEDAIQTIKQNKPHFILLDIMMPKINGFDVLKAIKADTETSAIPVAVLSALADDQKKKQAIGLGAVDFYVKSELLPIDVVEKIKRVIS